MRNPIRVIVEKISRELPARNIEHNGRPYLRRFHLGTIFGVRFYLHHFIDSDPDGLHNHPWRFGGSFVLVGHYYEERRFCMGVNARRINLINIINGDTLHRVVIPRALKAVAPGFFWHWVVFPKKGVWTLFWHTTPRMMWATLKDKGTFTQYLPHAPNFPRDEGGHSTWWKSAPKGKELFE